MAANPYSVGDVVRVSGVELPTFETENGELFGDRIYTERVYFDPPGSEMTVVRKSDVSHATMNGGGWDVWLYCPHSGIFASARTTSRGRIF